MLIKSSNSRLLLVIAAIVLIIGFLFANNSSADAVRFINPNTVYTGYSLFSPLNSTNTFLIDNSGRIINSWESEYFPGNSLYLQEDGTLYRGGKLNQDAITHGGASGIIERYSWTGEKLWEFKYATDDYIYHHDYEVMPNGNILLLVWQRVSKKQALKAGMSPDYVTNKGIVYERIIEINPKQDNKIVWEWKTWDHVIQGKFANKANYGSPDENPQLINLNYFKYSRESDWQHANSIDYNPQLDQILISVREFNEVWIIDHSTTTKQASGHTGGKYGIGGDLLYRWGNPEAYGQGSKKDRILFKQHDAKWIDPGLPGEGNILVFSNGQNEVREYSTVIEMIPPLKRDGTYEIRNNKFINGKITWEYGEAETERFYSYFISGAQRLQNGNTLITDGANGIFLEVTKDKEKAWEYLNPRLDYSISKDKEVREVFRVTKYPTDFAGFRGQELIPREKLRDN